MIVEAKDVRFYEITEIGNNGDKILRISGLVFHSSMSVKDIIQNFDGDSAIIHVILTPAHAGLSGRFSVDVPLRNNIRVVFFRNSLTQIWPPIEELKSKQ